MARKSRTHYEVLGVERSADTEQIRRAYLAAARKWHPDRFAGRPPEESARAEVAMRRVNEAWATLGNAAARRRYDLEVFDHGPSSFDGIRVDDGVTRIDPRLLDPEFLAARRDAQIREISTRSALALRVAPVLAVLGLLLGIFIFTAYAANRVRGPAPTPVPGPPLGAGIEANDCVDVIGGPALLEVPCTATADGQVISAHLGDGVCPPMTTTEVELSNGVVVCLRSTS